ncbi:MULTISPECIES: EF-hand domain-containing protein [Desulfococcus]|uniref:EF-Hand domain protein n=1 Tax=Desulfococcus multivorans DSM 2059 TaxID=1121405 RepID=S7UZN7_DESML|nr:EF-hand domain-containing protein [Desulfococcus multivorans]AOY60621.1 uncharacterized protein Dmul_38530 [Desulfococcus multivorans]EPR39669.1 EF-Hand domain protein [Desulfococcus multivorans DSM 2059]MDX9818253.1 EF-hand domain-containing protein [Desulfococcus multivorans]SKA03648.1 EF-hand domain pair [Desulfococcus multivorans DSM 2059]
MKTLYAVLISAMLALTPGGAWAAESDSGHGAMTGGMDLKKYEIRFNSIDTDGDGALNWSEYNDHFGDKDRKIFDALDTDDSGLVEQKEWHDFKAAHGMAGPQKNGKGRYHQADLPDPAPYMIPIGQIDKNGDNALSREEFQSRFPESDKSIFDAVDVNQDGSISQGEWHEFKAAHGKEKRYHHKSGS